MSITKLCPSTISWKKNFTLYDILVSKEKWILNLHNGYFRVKYINAIE